MQLQHTKCASKRNLILSTNSMQYSVKAGVPTKFEVWSTSGQQAWDQFLLREKMTYSRTFRSGPRLFGVSCDALQTALLAKRNTKTRVEETKTKIRTPQTRLELKEVSQNVGNVTHNKDEMEVCVFMRCVYFCVSVYFSLACEHHVCFFG